MSRAVLLSVAVLALGFAPLPFLAPKPGSVEADLKALQGTWELVGCNQQGEDQEVKPGGYLMTFAADRSVRITNGLHPFNVALDPAKTPKTIDFKGDGEDDMKGIYRLEGDTLTLCVGYWWEPVARPASFIPRVKVAVMVLKRKKP